MNADDHRAAGLRKLEALYDLCRQIEPDSMSLFDTLAEKKMSGGDPDDDRFAAFDGSDVAVFMSRALFRLAAAMRETEDAFQSLRVAEYIGNSPEKFLP